MNGFDDMWVGANGNTQPVLRLKNNGDVWIGGTADADANILRFEKSSGTLTLGSNVLGNVWERSLVVGQNIPLAYGRNSIVNGSGHNGLFINSSVSGKDHTAVYTSNSIVSGQSIAMGNGFNMCIILGENSSTDEMTNNILRVSNSTLSNVRLGLFNAHDCNIKYIQRSLISGQNIVVGATAANMFADRTDDLVALGTDLVIGKSSLSSTIIGRFITTPNDLQIGYGFGEHHTINSGNSMTWGFYSTDFTGQTSNDEIATDYLERVGNGTYNVSNVQTKSNARTVLKNGATQINNLSFGIGTTQDQATPAAALDVVSNSSGFLAPRMTESEITTFVSTLNLTTDVNGGPKGIYYSKKGMEINCIDCTSLDGSTSGVKVSIYPNAAVTAWVIKKLW